MLLWFAGLSAVLVRQVFRDPTMDYRLVAVGAILPDLVGRPAHSVLFSVALLVGVMAATRGKRDARRRWLALPIGTFMHLVLDGMWARTGVFWWPLLGGSGDWDGIPSLDRPVAVLVVQEVVGAFCSWFVYRQVHEAGTEGGRRGR